MREIKLKAWVGKRKFDNGFSGITEFEMMIDVNDISFSEGKIDYVNDDDGEEYACFDGSLKVVLQYTGLKDIEQFDEPKELYTGDIVSMHQFLFDGNEVENEIIGVLSYDEEVAAVCLTKINSDYLQKYMGYENDEIGFKREKIPVCMFYGLHECSWTYLGNIYENPELLEGVTS
ncbi:YopX family protein [Virgibacillus salexigens]|uniref:YopX protein domain-containing protein n=1 Tax=Virgibacillus kapii TaxID=1638645 RepID=A0ABQ2DA33_9BACI|nr:YopX family protein [Virgibacillus kapii]GGJ51166.1 hypothetical protein GCM10007111_11740 [Virgibacillus kapii]